MQIIQNRKKFFILSLLVIIIGFGFMIANAQAGKGALNRRYLHGTEYER